MNELLGDGQFLDGAGPGPGGVYKCLLAIPSLMA